jgi:hypothetical protein
MSGLSPARQWATFIGRYTPEIRSLATAAIARIRRQLPGAVELVYENYNALVIGFGPSERASEAIVSIALYPRSVNLFFLQGVKLSDPQRLLKGSGKQVRRISVEDASVLDTTPVRALVARALKASPNQWPLQRRRRMVIRAVSAKLRPRRPRV